MMALVGKVIWKLIISNEYTDGYHFRQYNIHKYFKGLGGTFELIVWTTETLFDVLCNLFKKK